MFYLENSTPRGPIAAEKLIAMVERGELPTEQWVLVDGQSEWEHYLDWLERQPSQAPAPAPPQRPAEQAKSITLASAAASGSALPAKANAPSREESDEQFLPSGSGLRMLEPQKIEPRPTSTVPLKTDGVACAVCHSIWAEHLTSSHGLQGGRICRLCAAKETELANIESSRKAGLRGLPIPWFTLGIVGFGIAFISLTAYWLLPTFFTNRRVPNVTVYERWSGNPVDKWPPIVLANAAKFKQQPAVRASLSILIRRQRDVIGGTAGTVLGGSKNRDDMNALLPADARPGLAPREVDGELVSWTATAPESPKIPVKFSAVAGLGEAYNYKSRFFVTDASAKKTPVELLSVRRAPFASGNPCAVIYLPPGDKQQRGMQGTVQRLGAGETLSITLEKPIPAVGLAGAPIFDLGGQLGGIVYAAGEPVAKDGTVRKLIAEPVDQFDTWLGFR